MLPPTDYNGVKPLNQTTAISVQIGPTASEFLQISAAKMDTTALGVSAISVRYVSVANTAITIQSILLSTLYLPTELSLEHLRTVLSTPSTTLRPQTRT